MAAENYCTEMRFLLRSIQLRGMLQQCRNNFGRSSEHSCGESLLNSDAGRGQACLSLSSSTPCNTKSCHLWRQVAYNCISDGYFTTALKYKRRLFFLSLSLPVFLILIWCMCVCVRRLIFLIKKIIKIWRSTPKGHALPLVNFHAHGDELSS